MKKIFRRLRWKMQLLNAIQATIVNASDAGVLVKTIKEESIEKITIAPVRDFIEKGEISFKTPKLNLMKYNKAMIFSASDFILCEKGAVWEKFNAPQFTKIIPIDRDLLICTKSRLFIKKPQKIVNVKIGYSLCGVHSYAWTHFLVQYLPKLYLVDEIRKTTNETITIVLPNNTDPHIQELVYNYRDAVKGVEIIELKNNEVALCDVLYHIGNTAWLSENIKDIGPADEIIPKFVADSIKNNLSGYFSIIDKEENKPESKARNKLFIARDIIRNILNYGEVEEYFKQKGYLIVKPHSIKLLEKIRLFRNASLIVGPLSGGFTNLLFCRKGTKVLALSSYQRCVDTYLGFYYANFDIDVTVIAGCDEHKNYLNSSFIIPFTKIKSACDELGF